MKDRNTFEEAKYDRDCQEAHDILVEHGRPLAQTAYEAGELDDWLEDECDPSDAFKIAHATLQWLDLFLASKYDSLEEALNALSHALPPLSVRDFRSQVEHVIEQKAIQIAEDM